MCIRDRGDGQALRYDAASGKIKPIDDPEIEGGGDMTKAVFDPQDIDDDAFDRTNHTGEQPISSITNLQTKLDALEDDVEANTTSVSANTSAIDDLETAQASTQEDVEDLETTINSLNGKYLPHAKTAIPYWGVVGDLDAGWQVCDGTNGTQT